jgi:hypothetical protein
MTIDFSSININNIIRRLSKDGSIPVFRRLRDGSITDWAVGQITEIKDDGTVSINWSHFSELTDLRPKEDNFKIIAHEDVFILE